MGLGGFVSVYRRRGQQGAGARPGTALALAIGLCLLLLVLGARWVRDRQVERGSLPLFEGSLLAPGLTAPLQIRRDASGVPHLSARTEEDAWFGLGFVHAQDRLGQMLWLRQLARGRVAEWLGESGRLSDRFVRSVDLAGHASRTWEELPEATRAVLDRYAQGVAFRIDRIRSGASGRPAALARLDIPADQIEPWVGADSVAVFKLLCWGAGASIEAASVLDQLTQRLGGIGARPFEPQGEGLQGLAVGFSPPDGAPAPVVPGARADALVPILYGGSAWVVAGRHTASGLPLLAADWHLAPTVPALLHQSHVRSPGLEWAGAFVPGIPVAWLGRNPEVAWALVPARAVTTGFFEETLRTRGPVVLYHDGDVWQPLARRSETIRVRQEDGSLVDEEWVVQSTRHGPLIDPLFLTEHAPLALAWTGARAGDGLTPLLRIARSESAAALRAELQSHHEPVVAAVFADAGGNAGVQVAGWLPRRFLPTSLQPVPGRLRTYDWGSRIPFEELPRAELVASKRASRRRVQPDWLAVADAGWSESTPSGPGDAEWLWRSGRRAARLERLLGRYVARGRVDLRDVIEIQRDAVSAGGAAYVRAIASVAGDPAALAPEEAEILQSLRDWDGGLGPESRPGAVHAVLQEELSAAFFEREMGSTLFDRYRRLPQVRLDHITRGVVLAAVLSPDAQGWAAADRVRPRVLEALRRTWARVTHELGPNRQRWTWGRLQRTRFEPFIPFAGGRSLSAGGPLGGGENALATAAHDAHFQVVRANIYRMAVDLAVPEEMVVSLAPGQLEHPGHPHADDGLASWRAGQPAVVRTAAGLIDATQERVLVLEPAP